MNATLKQNRYEEQKAIYPDCLVLFKNGNLYEALHDDSYTIENYFLGKLSLFTTREVMDDDHGFWATAFSRNDLDSILPVLFRKGHRVVLSDYQS